MKTLIMSAFILMSLNSFGASASKVEKFLDGLAGEYRLFANLTTGSGTCPENLTIETEDRLLKIINHDRPKPGYQKSFSRIGKRRSRVGDDMFTYIDYLNPLSKDGLTVLGKSRNCGGIVIIRCNDYVENDRFTRLSDDLVEVWVNDRAISYDSSGFPAGPCQYQMVR